ncbi:MAG: hypothetical protein ACP5JG_15485 [Anaerolineae bacterium]
MMTVFALVDTYRAAKALVDELMGAGIDVEDMNVIVKSEVAKSAMDHVDFSQMGVDVTNEVGEQRYQGLDYLIVGEQAVELVGLGDVFAAGELATLMATAATRPRDEAGTAMAAALQEFSVSPSAAETYYEGLDGAGWLVFVRTEDDKAQDARPIMRKHSDAVEVVSG